MIVLVEFMFLQLKVTSRLLVTVIDCGHFPTLTNGYYVLIDSTDTTYGAKADVRCNDGYNASIDVITCTIHRTWQTSTCRAAGMYWRH